jgi:predicted membrane protein
MPPATETSERTDGRPGLALLPLLIALALMLLMTVLPGLATNRHGQADHPAALLAFWAMSAGFVRGVGFIPRHALPRLLLSGLACGFALLLAGIRLAWLERLPWLF